MATPRNETIPPSYAASLHESTISSETYDSRRASFSDDLPVYGPRRQSSSRSSRREALTQTKEFPFVIEHGGKEVVNLTLITERAFSKHVPTVLQDSPLKGKVHLNLEKPETIQSVVISVGVLGFIDGFGITDTVDSRKVPDGR